MSQNQPETSSGLGLKIGGVIAVALVGVLYLAYSRSPAPSGPEVESSEATNPDGRSDDGLQGNPRQGRPGDMQLGSGDGIEERAQLEATPIQRPGMLGQANVPPGAPIDIVDADDPEDLPTLSQMALTDPDPERRLTAVTLLGVSENPDAIPILAQALSDQDEEVRMEAVLALADFIDAAPVAALEIALSDPSADIRYEALDVLSDIETPEAYQAMTRALDDSDDDVRELAELLSELYAEEDYAQQ